MKKHIVILFVLFLSILSFKNTYATHLVGMDANWKCLGNDTFEITLVIYRRCTDGATNLSIYPPIITSDSCANSYTLSAPALQSHTIEDVTPLCASQQKLCPGFGGTGSSSAQVPLGIERHFLVYKVYLGGNFANCCWYKIHWEQTSRSSNITTGFADQNFMNEFWLNRCICNNSPRFTGNPLIIKSVGQDVRYNLGMVDDEGDSLSYTLSQPLGGGSYSSPWSFTYPLTCYGSNNLNPNSNPPSGFNLDPVTGDIVFRPTAVQISVIKITIREWRLIGGVLKVINVTSRDLMMVVVQNNFNAVPVLSGPYAYYICAGTQTCFAVNTSDADYADTSRLRSSSSVSIPNSTFTISADTAKRATGTFCWTPDSSNVRIKPYYFVARTYDNHCPLYGEAYRTYTIYVNPKFQVSTKIESITCSDFNFKALNTDVSTITRKWQVYKGTMLMETFMNTDTVLNYKFNSSGTYYIKYTASTLFCTTKKIDTVVITNATPLQLVTSKDTLLCKGNSIILSTVPINGVAPYAYKWYLNGALVDTSQSFTVTPTINSKYIVQVFSGDSCMMNDRDTINISLDSLRLNVVPLNDTTVCPGAPLNLTHTITTGKPPLQYKWYKDGVLVNTTATFSITPNASADYIINIFSADNCFNEYRDTINITVDTSVLKVIPIRDTIICPGTSLNISPGIISGKPPLQYKWYYNGLLISTAATLSITPPANSEYILNIFSSDKCISQFLDTINISVDASNLKVNLLRDTIICKGSSLTIAPIIKSGTAPFQFQWYRNGILISTSGTLSITPISTADYILNIVSADNCFNLFRDTFTISVFSHLISLSAGNTNILSGQSTVIKSNGISNFNWSGNNIISNWGDSVLVKPNVAATYQLICRNIYGCIDTAQITINVSNVGIKSEAKKERKLMIDPNPAFNQLTIYASANVQVTIVNAEYRIYNVLGQVALAGRLIENKTIVDISYLAPGVYFVSVGEEVRKFVKE